MNIITTHPYRGSAVYSSTEAAARNKKQLKWIVLEGRREKLGKRWIMDKYVGGGRDVEMDTYGTNFGFFKIRFK